MLDLNVFMRSHINVLYRCCYTIAQSHWFILLITFLIIANTVFLSMDHHPMDESLQSVLDTSNLLFTVLFSVEMVIKLLGLGFRGYARDKFNLFDALIVIISLVEIAIYMGGDQDSGRSGGAISALRTFRLLRVFRLARNWTGLRDLLVIIGKTLKDMSNFSVLLLLLMFIYTLVGMEFFAYRMKFDRNYKLDL